MTGKRETVNRQSVVMPFLLSIMAACSTGKPIQSVCSSTKSLIRFDQDNVNVANSGMIQQFGSQGGFIEVFTRKEVLGKIDSSRLCTSYVEFSDSPADAPTPSDSSPIELTIYTASHCLDLSKDYRI